MYVILDCIFMTPEWPDYVLGKLVIIEFWVPVFGQSIHRRFIYVIAWYSREGDPLGAHITTSWLTGSACSQKTHRVGQTKSSVSLISDAKTSCAFISVHTYVSMALCKTDNSSVLEKEVLQFCTKPLICVYLKFFDDWTCINNKASWIFISFNKKKSRFFFF